MLDMASREEKENKKNADWERRSKILTVCR